MTDLSDRTETPLPDPDPSAAGPDDHPAAQPPAVHFVPVEGERLEQMATCGRPPVRWAAAALLRLQATTLRSPGPEPAPPETVLPRPAGEQQVTVGSGVAGGRIPYEKPPAAEDDQSWQAWEDLGTTGGTEERLAFLDRELARPLPVPLRVADRWRGRRRGLGEPSGRRRRHLIDGAD